MPVYIPQAKTWGFDGGVIIFVSPRVFRSNTRNNIYVKIKAFFRIKFYISENFRFINLHRIINFCLITPVRLFNTVPKYRDVACLTRMGGTHHLRAET